VFVQTYRLAFDCVKSGDWKLYEWVEVRFHMNETGICDWVYGLVSTCRMVPVKSGPTPVWLNIIVNMG
jgi:hypothetical protein